MLKETLESDMVNPKDSLIRTLGVFPALDLSKITQKQENKKSMKNYEENIEGNFKEHIKNIKENIENHEENIEIIDKNDIDSAISIESPIHADDNSSEIEEIADKVDDKFLKPMNESK